MLEILCFFERKQKNRHFYEYVYESVVQVEIELSPNKNTPICILNL